VRPSRTIVGFVILSSLAACTILGDVAQAQQGTSSNRAPHRNSAPAATPRGGTTQQAAYQEVGQPAGPPAELPPPNNGAPPSAPQTYYDYPASEPAMFEDGGTYTGYAGYGYPGPLGFGVLGGLWVRGEYLVWDLKGMNTPPLVISSTLNNIDPVDLHLNDNGNLGATPPVVILFGGDRLNDDAQNGAKISFGGWLDDCHTLGIEADVFGIDTASSGYFRNSASGNPILARPFYNVLTGLESSTLISFPNAVDGLVHRGLIDIIAQTEFNGAGARAIINLGCNSGCGTSWWNGCPLPTTARVDLLVGYRYLRLDDSLVIIERSSITPGGDFDIYDGFHTENTFNGFDFGMLLSHQRGCWSIEVLSKIALGNTRSQVDIRGNTIITPTGGPAQQFQGGILAQRTNIGHYQDDEFSVVPELGVTLGYSLNPCWKVTVGYTWLYWSRVARAGDQIDRNLNPDLFPEEANPPTDTHLQPRFRFMHEDLWVHGLRLGLEANW
jgi:hypothetical protein